MLDEFLASYAKTYAFETGLWVKDGSGGILYPAIAVNLGHTNSKVFDSVWRMECPECEGKGEVSGVGGTCKEERECSECLGAGYIEPYDIMITFVRRPDKLWHVSLYSTKEDVDCGAIARSFGGGGHKGAAGFQCKELPFDY